jgi:hypothetical protein
MSTVRTGRGVCAEIIAPKELRYCQPSGCDDKIGLDSRGATIVRLKARLTGEFSAREYRLLDTFASVMRTQTFRL